MFVSELKYGNEIKLLNIERNKNHRPFHLDRILVS